jgi:L-alanine-DL-glutamate epimerase-like enolase superfamily enzyme
LTDRVVSVEAATVVLDLPEPLRVGPMTIVSREYATLRLTTEAGVVGKAYCLTRNAPVAACVERLVAPNVRGADSAGIRNIWERCIRANVMVGRTGLVLRALGLADVALWDVAAQRAGVPLHALLGQEPAPVPVVMVAAYPVSSRTVEELAGDVLAYAAAGYRLLKVARTADSAFMRRWLERIAADLPATARLVVDAGYGWTSYTDALAEVSSWGPYELAWLEDPLVPEDVSGITRLRRDGPHPIGVGDELAEKSTFEALLRADALDVLRLDVISVGGVTGALEVLELASDARVPVSFHVLPELTVHLATGLPGAMVETFDPEMPGGNPYDPVHELTSGRLAVSEGLARPPRAPGIGFELLHPPRARSIPSERAGAR